MSTLTNLQTDPAAAAPTGDVVLTLAVRGFNAVERRLLEGTIKLSQRRPPRIELIDDAAAADVLLLDAQDAETLRWAQLQPWLADKAVLWAGAKAVRPKHVAIDRHVKWPILPVLLYRALEQRGQAAPAMAAPAPTAEPQPARTRRVLVIDDSLAARAHLRLLLERQGVEVLELDNAESGIAAAELESFAFVLLDVLMPGIDGFEACRRIKARAGSPPVVMLTSKSSPFDRVRGKMAGCDTYLTKPVDAEQLREVVARHAAGPAAAPRTPFAPLRPLAA